MGVIGKGDRGLVIKGCEVSVALNLPRFVLCRVRAFGAVCRFK